MVARASQMQHQRRVRSGVLGLQQLHPRHVALGRQRRHHPVDVRRQELPLELLILYATKLALSDLAPLNLQVWWLSFEVLFVCFPVHCLQVAPALGKEGIQGCEAMHSLRPGEVYGSRGGGGQGGDQGIQSGDLSGDLLHRHVRRREDFQVTTAEPRRGFRARRAPAGGTMYTATWQTQPVSLQWSPSVTPPAVVGGLKTGAVGCRG
mmetsp:Transcript_25197/g.70462  ORF Transcript_25197/g.70462 Transcript_25197/m.70462 type:complete len:207 (+) Transcript_25197:1053-1673(+)